MARYILRYRGAAARPDTDAARIAALPGVEVVDDSPRMLLVDAPETTLREALKGMAGWVMSAERPVPLPDARRRPRGHS
jgi:hypothetical protein